MTTRWLTQVGIASTRWWNAFLGGLADETMSSRAHRMDYRGKPWGQIARPLIDAFFRLFGQHHHCATAYVSDRSKPPLPEVGERT